MGQRLIDNVARQALQKFSCFGPKESAEWASKLQGTRGTAGDMTEETDDVLAVRAQSGSRAALEALVDRHYATIHRIAWRHCGDRTEAEDIAQDACIRIASSIGSFERRASFATWYHGIVLNAARDAFRARGRVNALAVAMATVGPEEPGETEIGRCGAEDALWSAVRALPERQREAVQLVYIEGMSHRQAARLIGCAEATVSWHLFAARRAMKALLGKIER
jgi:RNA polymerase sigma-70 factor (ECF subfamily)